MASRDGVSGLRAVDRRGTLPFFMSDKQLVLNTVQELPESATLEQIREEITLFVADQRGVADEEAAILAAIRRGEADVAAGRVVSTEEMRRRVVEWTSK